MYCGLEGRQGSVDPLEDLVGWLAPAAAIALCEDDTLVIHMYPCMRAQETIADDGTHEKFKPDGLQESDIDRLSGSMQAQSPGASTGADANADSSARACV